MSHPQHLIFVNYRGSDEIWATEYVYARMTEAFGADAVFKAGNALKPGDPYPQILDEKAAHCPVMLVCIGPSWADTKDAAGARRLDSPDDWVRKEIKLALRADNLVVPLLIGNHGEVSVPSAEKLPEDLRDLVGRPARRIAPGGGLDATMPALIAELAAAVPELGALREERQNPAKTHQDSGSDENQSAGAVFHINKVKGDAVGRDKIVGGRP
jgi:hypothetical protein